MAVEKMENRKTKVISVSLPTPEDVTDVQLAARAAGVTISDWVRAAVADKHRKDGTGSST